MKTGRKTRRRVERAIDLISDDVKSDIGDYALIADIILLLASEQYMSTTRAQNILKDAEKILPHITELKLL